ncbi:hypothetical protein PJP14_29435, partial [Mycobacterium kansasii]
HYAPHASRVKIQWPRWCFKDEMEEKLGRKGAREWWKWWDIPTSYNGKERNEMKEKEEKGELYRRNDGNVRK